jgi:hypothetical protein
MKRVPFGEGDGDEKAEEMMKSSVTSIINAKSPAFLWGNAGLIRFCSGHRTAPQLLATFSVCSRTLSSAVSVSLMPPFSLC